MEDDRHKKMVIKLRIAYKPSERIVPDTDSEYETLPEDSWPGGSNEIKMPDEAEPDESYASSENQTARIHHCNGDCKSNTPSDFVDTRAIKASIEELDNVLFVLGLRQELATSYEPEHDLDSECTDESPGTSECTSREESSGSYYSTEGSVLSETNSSESRSNLDFEEPENESPTEFQGQESPRSAQSNSSLWYQMRNANWVDPKCAHGITWDMSDLDDYLPTPSMEHAVDEMYLFGSEPSSSRYSSQDEGMIEYVRSTVDSIFDVPTTDSVRRPRYYPSPGCEGGCPSPPYEKTHAPSIDRVGLHSQGEGDHGVQSASPSPNIDEDLLSELNSLRERLTKVESIYQDGIAVFRGQMRQINNAYEEAKRDHELAKTRLTHQISTLTEYIKSLETDRVQVWATRKELLTDYKKFHQDRIVRLDQLIAYYLGEVAAFENKGGRFRRSAVKTWTKIKGKLVCHRSTKSHRTS